MTTRTSCADRCRQGRHTPTARGTVTDGTVRRSVCRCCRRAIMRTQATRIWFLATLLA